MTEPTLKEWKRRALKAEEELSIITGIRQFDGQRELNMARENAALRVSLREIMDASNWAYGVVANNFGRLE